MPTATKIKSLLNGFNPIHIRLDDISYQHAGGPEAESHFYLELVSAEFSKQSLLARQRQVNTVLKPLAGSYHALAMRLYTPEEWQQLEGEPQPAPQCAHHREASD